MKEKPRRGKRHALLKTLTAAVGAATLFDGYFNHALAATFTASWKGQASGSYSVPFNWSTSSVPNDFAGNDYNVIISRPLGAAVEGNVTAEILNLTVGAGNSLSLDPGIQLVLIGQANGGPATISNDGTIALNSNASNQARLEFTNGPTSLIGSGTITMSGDSLFANPPGGFSSTNLIRGSGGIEFFTIENDGTILADSSDGSLNLSPTTTMTNNGWLCATGPGVLVISAGSLITNTGTISADSNGIVQIGNQSITGGTLATSSGGAFLVPSSGTAALGSSTSSATINLADSTTLSLTGNIVNNGAINVAAGANPTRLLIGSGSVALSGTGTVTLSASGAGTAVIDGAGGTLSVGSGQLIHGAGTISTSLSIHNSGTISADRNAQTMTINVGTATMFNSGYLTSAGFGALVLSGSGVIDNSGGTIESLGSTFYVQLANGITIYGGTLSISPALGGILINSSTATLVAVTNRGDLNLADGTMTLSSTVNNTGQIIIGVSSQAATLSVPANGLTLNGSGNLELGGPTMTLGGVGALTNGSLQTIGGSGVLCNNSIALNNNGTIEAYHTGETLIVNPNLGRLASSGTMLGTSGATLSILNNYSLGTFTNSGTIIAQSGGTVTISGSGALDSSSGTMIVQSGGALINSTTLTVPAIQVDGQFTNLLALHGSGTTSTMISGAGSFTNGDAAHTSANALVTAMRVSTFTAGGGVTTVKSGGGTLGTSLLSSLSIASGAKLDLTDHDMVIDYSGNSPLNAIAGLLSSGYAHGAWNGAGIDSSIAAAIDTPAQPHPVALGYGEASTLGITGTFSGQNIDNTTVLIKYTYAGDANLDGRVDVADLYLLASHWNTSGDVWSGGDFNYDGLTNINDLNLLAQNWNAGQGNPLSPALGPVLTSLGLPLGDIPQPNGVALLVATGLQWRRRRKTGR